MDESTQEIKKYLAELPKQLQQMVLSPDWHKRLADIAQKYSLHLDQISSLEYEVLFVMIGMEPEDDLVGNIQKEVGTSRILAEQLAEDINVRIFQYMMKSLVEKNPDTPDRFMEVGKGTNNEARITNYESERKESAEKTLESQNPLLNSSPSDMVIVKPLSSAPAPAETEIQFGKNGQEKLSVDVLHPETEIPATEIKITPVSVTPHASSLKPQDSTLDAPHQKTTEPPVNLPTENIDEDMTQKATDVDEIKPVVKTSLFVPPISNLKPQAVSSLADTKLPPLPQIQSEVAPKPMVSNYTVDPYREPIE